MHGAAHLILYVADQARSAAFHGAVLGWGPRLDVPGMTEFDLPGGAVLGLMPEDGIARLLPDIPHPASGGRAPRAELYLLTADAAGMHARAVAAGGTLLSPPAMRDWGHVVGYVRDPDGHVLAFAEAPAVTPR